MMSDFSAPPAETTTATETPLPLMICGVVVGLVLIVMLAVLVWSMASGVDD